MPTKYRPITQKEKVKEIGIGLLLALIFAPALGGIVQLLFQWGADFLTLPQTHHQIANSPTSLTGQSGLRTHIKPAKINRTVSLSEWND